MNESLVKYLAGLLDADGSMSFNFRRNENDHNMYYVTVQVKLASSDAVDRHGFVYSLDELTGMGSTSRNGKKSQYITWNVSKRSDVEMLLPRLTKHMVIKAQHWQWVFEMWRNIRSKSFTEDQRALLTQAIKESRKLRVGPLKPKKHPTWAWLAGYLDGDGWYRYSYEKKQNYYQMQVGAVAHTTDAIVLEFIREAFGGYIYDHGQSENCKVWRRNLGVKDRSFALRFLPNVAKHSKLKRHKINEMIHHHRQRLSDLSPEG